MTKLTADAADFVESRLEHVLPFLRPYVKTLIATARASLESRGDAASPTYACDGSHGMSHHDPACGWTGVSMPYDERCPVCQGRVVTKRMPVPSAAGAGSTAEWARPESEWHEDIGDVLWWRFPIVESPYVGSPLDTGWPGYHTHWTPFSLPSPPKGAL